MTRNPCSTFQSLLHLFCNITSVPTQVEVFLNGGEISCATYITGRPPEPNGGAGPGQIMPAHVLNSEISCTGAARARPARCIAL